MNKKIEDSSSEPKKMDNILIGGFQDNHTFFMWQEVEEGEEPPICWGRIKKINKDSVEFKIKYIKKNEFIKDKTIYVFIKIKMQYVITTLKDLEDDILTIPFPEEFKKVDEEFKKKKIRVLTEQEENKCEKTMEAKKMKILEKKYVELKPRSDFADYSRYFLAGLTPTELSLWTLDLDEFELEEEITIHSISKKVFSPPLKGIVKSINPHQGGFFKIILGLKSTKEEAA